MKRCLILFLPFTALSVLLMGCPGPPGCNNSISGSGNVAACGGAGDGDTAVTPPPPPAPIVPVVVAPPASEPIAQQRADRDR